MLLSQNHTPTRGAPSTILSSAPLEKMGPVRGGRAGRRHRAGPHLGAVLDGNDVVGRAPWCRQPPLLDGVGLRVEHADAVAAIFGKPQPVLLVDAAATRARQCPRR